MTGPRKPKLIVFDLDYTLWPFFIEYAGPLHQHNGKIYDRQKGEVKAFPEASTVLEYLQKNGYELAVASRTSEIEGALQLVKFLNWDKYFKYKEIFPSCKVNHFSKFCKASGYKHEDMLFFDDEHRNIKDLSEKGVTCIHVPSEGVTMKLVETGLKRFEKV